MLLALPAALAVSEATAAALVPLGAGASAGNSTVEGGADSTCPNKCSGNGECMHGVCKCFPGYTYYDCSLRTRPRPHTHGPRSPLKRTHKRDSDDASPHARTHPASL